MFLLNVLGKVRWGAVNKYQSHIIMAYSTVSGCWMIQLFSTVPSLPSLTTAKWGTYWIGPSSIFPEPASGYDPWLHCFHHLVVFFSNVWPSLKLFPREVESVLRGRSDALQRRLIVLSWNSHLIAPLSTSRWLSFLSRACFDKWFHNLVSLVISHLPY